MVYEVIVDISNSEVDKVFDYHAPFPVEVGERVLVPFGRRQLEGYVIGVKEKSDTHFEIKDIIMRLDGTPAIIPEMLSLAKFMIKKNLRYVDCLRLFIPSKLRGGRVKIATENHLYYNTSLTLEDALAMLKKGAKAQEGIVRRMYEVGEEKESVINQEFNAQAVKTLIEKGILTRSTIERDRIPKGMEIARKVVTLTSEQQNAVDIINNSGKNTFLLHGVTGSGKTEIYMNIIESVLKEGKTAIMLVPEISLTPQMLGVFRARFGDEVSVLHSGLSDGERYDEWRRLRSGKARVALGARSAIFAPVSNLGAIIIDEEHDTSYVSDRNPRYFTVDIAEERARYNDAKLILGSATPSIETYYKAKQGKYHLITLRNRVNDKKMPEIETVDMKKEIRRGNVSVFSAPLLSALDETLQEGNQAMIFLNRRGYVSFVRCRSCGYVPKCPHCEVSLTHHKEDNTLRCHYCGSKFKMISECPICGYQDMRQGKVGTEKIVAELNRIFPQARVLRMDNDTTTTKDSYIKILSAFNNREADILVGTQMIAKGHDFANVTLVGIIDADISLFVSDFRANERTFQLITQVAGRAGRDNKPGRVIMQTFTPKHDVYRFAKNYDYEGFFDKEINTRETTKFPPFTKIVRLLVQGDEEQLTAGTARMLYEKLAVLPPQKKGVIRVQVMRAPIKRIEDKYRFQVVIWVDAKREDDVMPEIYEIGQSIQTKGVVIFTEINPQQML